MAPKTSYKLVMKIGILTLFHKNYNWGGNLQGYALKTYIENYFKDSDVDIINYISATNVIYKNKREQIAQYSLNEIIRKIIERKAAKRLTTNNKISKRKKLFDEFQEEFLTNKKYYNDENLNDLEAEYDCLICGSDQVWNPNVAKPGFFLKGISKVRKISYAASIARNELSQKEADAILPLVNEFDFISVREKTAKDILEKCLNDEKKVFEVIDPTLLLPREHWERLAINNDETHSKYALMFLFSDSVEYRRRIKKYCGDNDIELWGIPHASKYVENDETDDYKKIYDVGPKEFLGLIKNASYVFTDSFHGAVFSMIFQKNFCIFERDRSSKTSKNSRLYDLIDKFQISDRVVNHNADIDEILKKKIDYVNVDRILVSEQQKALAFLRDALNVPVDSIKKVETVSDQFRDKCTGCGMCAQECPKNCITLKQDSEGYKYPEIDETECVKCGLCLKTCITGNNENNNEKLKKTYIAYNKDDKIRENSSSGGAFFSIAKSFLLDDGIVYGAAFDSNYSVKHIRIDKDDNIELLMKSKYVQSTLEDIWDDLLTDLKSHKRVLFSGTPCQVAAVKQYAASKGISDTLFTMDFICHGVPSPAIWKSYLTFTTNNKKKIQSINFRDKKSNGWHDYHFCLEFEDHSYIKNSHDLNAYMSLFLTDRNIRPSCFNCCFKADNYYSDITLGDAWKIEKEHIEWADDKGTSLLIVRSKKGDKLISSGIELEFKSSEYEFWSKMNPSLIKTFPVGKGRAELFRDFERFGEIYFWNKYCKISHKRKARYFAKQFIKLIGLEKTLRKRV